MIQPWRWLRTTTTTNAVTLGLVLSAGVMGCRSTSEVIHQPTLAPVETAMVPALPIPVNTDDPSNPFFVATAPPVDDPAYDEGDKDTGSSPDSDGAKPKTVDPKTVQTKPDTDVGANDSKNEDPIEPLIAANGGKTDSTTTKDETDKVDDTKTEVDPVATTSDGKTTPVVPELPAIGKVETPKVETQVVETPKAESETQQPAQTDIELPPLKGEPKTVDAPEPKALNPDSKTNAAVSTSPLFPTEAPKVETPKIELPEVDSNVKKPTEPKPTATVEQPVATNFPLIESPTIEPAASKNTARTEVATDDGKTKADQEFAKVDVPALETAPAEELQIEVLAPELLATVEGSVHRLVVTDGKIFVSHSEGISVVGRDNKLTEFSSVGAPSGMIVSKTGAIVCDAEKRAVIRLDQTGKFAELIGSKSDGYFLRSPNSIVADNKGGYYFSDPGYARIRNAIGKVHYIDAAGKVTLAARKLAFPAGVAISNAGTHLLIVESQGNQLATFQILSPGKLGPKKTFAKLPKKQAGDKDDFASGLCIDDAGNVFVAHHGMQQVEVISSTGEWLQSIKLSGVTITDVAVLESGRRTILAVTGQSQGKKNGQIWRLPVDIKN